MNYKKITAAITAICLLSVATGATALAAKNIAADTAEDSVVTEETTEATEETTEEAADEEAAEDEEATDAPEVEAPEAEKPVKPAPPVIEDEEITEGEEVEEDTEKPEKPEKPAKPAKKAGKKEIVEMINVTFDLETADFVDEDAKAAWFEFCLNNLEDAAPKADKPAADKDADKPVKVKTDKKAIIEKINETFDLEACSFIDDDAKTAWFEYCTILNTKPEKPTAPAPEVDENGNVIKPEPPTPPTPELDENGSVIDSMTTSETWTGMWHRNYCELDIPRIPTTPGSYTVTVYFNGALAADVPFTVVE